MKKIIIINGSRNAGKTTVGTIVSESLEKTAFIDIDVMRDFVPFLLLKESIPLNLENAVSVARNILQKNMNIVMVYPLYQHERDFLEENLQQSSVKIFFFTLRPSLATALSNRGRAITKDDKKRIREMYAEGGECNGNHLGIVIDNTKLSPRETAREILHHIERE